MATSEFSPPGRSHRNSSVENSWPTVLKFVKSYEFYQFFKYVKIGKHSFLHISIKGKTITFLLHTTTVFWFLLLQYLLV